MPRPDEGLIHAWLDGQLPPDEAARIEHLVATDPEWAAAMAEARGFMAASRRILSALDHVPAGVVPKRTAAHAGQRLPWWTKVAAALVVMVGGSVFVIQRTPASDPAKPSAAKPTPVVSGLAPARAMTERPAPSPGIVTKKTAPVPAAAKVAVVPRQVDAAQDAASTARVDQPALKSTEGTVAPPLPAPVSSMLDAEMKAAAGAMSVAPASAGVRAVAATAVAATEVAARRATASKSAACYRLESDRSPPEFVGVMRAVRTDGDTLRLEPAQGTAPLRAWIAWHGRAWRGVVMPGPAARDTIPVVAARVDCPVP